MQIFERGDSGLNIANHCWVNATAYIGSTLGKGLPVMYYVC